MGSSFWSRKFGRARQPRFKTTDVTDKRYRKDRPPVVRRGFKAFLNDTEKK